jgi:hypothetical protein
MVIWGLLVCDKAVMFCVDKAFWKLPVLVILSSIMPLLHRGDPYSFTAGLVGSWVRTTRSSTEMWENFVVVWFYLFGLSNTQARHCSVRSKISGTAA